MTDSEPERGEEVGRTDASYVFGPVDVPRAAAVVDAAFTDLDFGYATVLRIQEAAKADFIGGTPLEMELIHAAGHCLQLEIGGKPGCGLGRPVLDPILTVAPANRSNAGRRRTSLARGSRNGNYTSSDRPLPGPPVQAGR